MNDTALLNTGIFLPFEGRKFFPAFPSKSPSHLAWKTRPKAPSPISLTYWMLFRGYSRASSLEFSNRGTRWYMGLGCSRSSRSSDGRALSVGVSITLREQKPEEWGIQRWIRNCAFLSFIYLPLSVPPLLSPPATGEDDNSEEDRSCKCSQEDYDDRHGVSWRWHCGHGRDMRSLTRARWLWFYHWQTHRHKVKISVQWASINCNLERISWL